MFSPLRFSHGLCRLGRQASLLSISRCVMLGFDTQGAGILTCSLFQSCRLRNSLVSTYPRLMNIVEEPLPLRRMGFSPIFAATPARILIRTRSTRTHALASTRARHLPTRSPFRCSQVSVADFSPVHFQRPKSRLVSCYALFKG